MAEEKQGKVYLIGAGPGDYKLITVKGRECIEKADVIIYDYLADNHLLQWARPEAELIYAGKQCKHHTLHQYEINELLVKYGREGKIVARLKGGDPLVFGRGGEEALVLKEAGVAYEFVPGVTSAIAAPAYAGIPVTQRAMATSFAIVTGHEDPTKGVSGIHWEGLAKAVDTITFVMGVGNLPLIAQKLMEHGRAADTPVAVIRWGTKPIQETLVSTLDHVVEDVKKAQIKPPSLIIVGQVVNLRKQLRWFDTKPLFGKTIVVTRARAQASALTNRLEELGANVLEAPAIKTQALPLSGDDEQVISHMAVYKALVFTSAQGVRYFFSALKGLHKDSRALAGLAVCAIGTATAKALERHGIQADLIPSNFQAESVVDALKASLPVQSRVLLIQPKKARKVIPEGLRQAGIEVDILRLYETVLEGAHSQEVKEALASDQVDYVTFTSSSTVRNTIDSLGQEAKELLGKARIACIGPITAATCQEEGLSVDLICQTYTIPALVELIVSDVREA